MTELNDAQRELLRNALAKKKTAKKVAADTNVSSVKKPVTREEYARNLNAHIADDASIASNHSAVRIQRELDAWHQRVGDRMSNAVAENPAVVEKINRRVGKIINGGPLHSNGLVLTGHLGTGKTWNAYAYIEKLIRAGVIANHEICAETEIGLLTPIALATFNRPDKMDEILHKKYKFYFIDEVGRATFKNPELRHEIWYELINHAYLHHIPVVLTTNKSTEQKNIREATTNKTYSNELEAWIGDAAYDRLRYMIGSDGAIVPSGENQRKATNARFDNGISNDKLQGNN